MHSTRAFTSCLNMSVTGDLRFFWGMLFHVHFVAGDGFVSHLGMVMCHIFSLEKQFRLSCGELHATLAPPM